MEPTSLDTTYVEVPCQRTVADDEFPRGVQDYNWSISNPTVWYPDRSYFRVDIEVLGSGDPVTSPVPKLSDQVALAEGAVNNAFVNAYFTAGGQLVSSLVNFLPQCGSVDSRYKQSSSNSWMKTVGGAFGISGSLSERISAISLGAGPVGVSGLDDHREEIYKPVKTSGKATLTVSSSATGPAAVTGGPATSGAAVTAGGEDQAAITAALATLQAQLDAALGAVKGFTDVALTTVKTSTDAALGVRVTITSGADAFASEFRDGVLDAGVKILIKDVPYIIVSIATNGGTFAQTITAYGPPGPDVGPTEEWYAVRRNLSRSQESHNKLQVLYRPPLGIFQYGQPMGAGQYKISLSPDSNYKYSMLESKVPDFTATGVDSRFSVRIKDIKFYACVGKLELPDAIVPLDLSEWHAQSRTMTDKNQQMQFTVPQSTEVIYIALQGSAAGSNPAWPPNKFTAPMDSDLNIEAIQVTYGNQTKPQTRWKTEFSGSTNHLKQFYYNTLVETQHHDNIGGAESFNQRLDRGPIYAFKFDRANNARDTEVTVQITYKDSAAGAFDTKSKIFVISEYRKLTKITHSNGSITQVISMNA